LRRSPWQWATLPLRHYAKFSGRAPRPEFWWFHLLTVLLWVAAITLDQFLPAAWLVDDAFGPLGIIVVAATVVPWLAALVRRLHDSGKSGWYALVTFMPYIGVLALFWLASRPGIPDANDYGEDPYGRTATTGLVEPTVRASARS